MIDISLAEPTVHTDTDITPPALPSTTDADPVTTATTAHVRLTGRMLNFTRLTIQGDDLPAILALIEQKFAKQRAHQLPVVVSCQQPLDLAALWEGLWQAGLQPIGLVTGLLDEQAQALRIAVFPADGQRIDGKKPQPPKVATLAATQQTVQAQADDLTGATHTDAKPSTTSIPAATEDSKFPVDADHSSHMEGDRVHNPILRSGQSINHVGGDLILTHGINAGAEAITDYSLHVYGKAEGRLVAGATGDKNAKIFCVKFNPSLVSVAGTYCLKENIPAEFINQAVQVSYVEGEGLVFERMD